MKNIVLLGATGSIGHNTLKVIRANKDKLRLVGIASNSNYRELAKIAEEFDVKHIAIHNEKSYKEAIESKSFKDEQTLYCGEEGLSNIACLDEADTVVVAVVGIAGLNPTLAAIENKKEIALANKEVLVMAGKFVMDAAAKNGVPVLPLDSEHNAIFQCIEGHKKEFVSKLILTASGGPFLNTPIEEMKHIRPEDALKHPNWSMGQKVTIDSSTMANKGLELIEAHWLFAQEAHQLKVVVHPQSIVHSMVEFIDGSILAHLSPPSMTFPIHYSLLYPERSEKVNETLDFNQLINLNFQPPDFKKFRCLQLALDCLKTGKTAATIYNAANEVAVASFLDNELPYLRIADVMEETLNQSQIKDPVTLEDAIEADKEARIIALNLIDKS